MTTALLIAPLVIFLAAMIAAVGAGALLAPSGEAANLRPSKSALRAVSFGLPCGR